MADYKGANFYDNMYFFTFKDPTKGLVDFVGKDEASSLGLIKTTNGGQVYMGYATTRVYPASATSTSTAAPNQRRQVSSSSSSSSSSASASSNANGQAGVEAVTTTSSTPTRSASTTSASSTSTSTSTSASTTTSAAPIPYMKSVRISSFDTFTTGVFILDASHMPVGCGIWPSWWTVPTNPAGGWPNGGEIDIVEGISYTSQNTYSVHTIPGCKVNSTTNSQLGTYQLSNLTLATNCASSETGNQGCGVQSSLRNDFGTGYNANGGGIHAMVWDKDTGIKSWFFNRNSVPADIAAGKPDPTSWGTPQGSWPAQDCDPTKFFFNHVSVFSNTICGDWAGNKQLWNNAWNGQKQSCAAMTGYSSCQAYVQSKDVDFSEAYWLINSVKVYQTARTA